MGWRVQGRDEVGCLRARRPRLLLILDTQIPGAALATMRKKTVSVPTTGTAHDCPSLLPHPALLTFVKAPE
jgi:hypothetical protein